MNEQFSDFVSVLAKVYRFIMGNKYRAMHCRSRKDPRTKKRMSNPTKRTLKAPKQSTTTSASDASLVENSSSVASCPSAASPSSSAETPVPTASERKISSFTKNRIEEEDDPLFTYVLMDVDIMCSVFSELIKCPTCKFPVEIKLWVEKLSRDFQIYLKYAVKILDARGVNRFIRARSRTEKVVELIILILIYDPFWPSGRLGKGILLYNLFVDT